MRRKLYNTTPYQAALEYINLGLAVFPLKYRDKTPLTPNGCKDATRDAAIIKGWWQRWPNANVGIATGSISGGLFVIDLDIDDQKGINGYHTLRDWEREHGEFPDTWSSITGRGGTHLFFRTNKKVQNRGGILEGIDVRGEGGYIVAPPSVHQNGNAYEWEYAPDEFELAEASDLVLKFLETKKTTHTEFKAPDIIQDGKRNDTLYRLACSLQAKNLSDEAIKAALEIENETRCKPPLDDEELEKILKSALSHDKGVTVVKPDKVDNPKNVFEVKALLVTNDKGKPAQTIDNICTVLRNDPALKDKLKYNTLSYSTYIFGDVPWERIENYREWTNTDDSSLKCYIESNYGLRSTERIMDAFNIVTNENRFNPVVEYLESLKWDGKPHIENLLPNYLGVEKTEYTIEAMKLFMLGAINRAYYPGCKFDYMPVLVGEQGVGKSTFFRILAGNDNWYNDNFNTVDGDKAAEKLRGMWIVELAELLAVKRSQAVESIKAFLTSTVDTYRPPYQRRTEQRPRMCVFGGTTNSTQFLTDRTGNRRYLPLLVRKDHVKKSMFKDKEAVIEDFAQAWAEAMHIFKSENPPLIFPEHLQEEVREIQATYTEEDVRVGIIQEWLDNYDGDHVCVAQIYEKALGNDLKPDRRTSTEIHDIMQHQIKGWVPADTKSGKRRIGKYGNQICYDRVREAPKNADEDGFVKVSESDVKNLPFM